MNKAEVIYPFAHTFLDYPSPEGGALLVSLTGCSHGCLYCQNKKLQRQGQKDGVFITAEDLFTMLRAEAKRYKDTRKVVLAGADPFWRGNVKFTRDFLRYNAVMADNFQVCLYTGNTVKQIRDGEIGTKILDEGKFEYLKTGRYIYNRRVTPEKTGEYMQLASINQEFYDYRCVKISDDRGRLGFENL